MDSMLRENTLFVTRSDERLSTGGKMNKDGQQRDWSNHLRNVSHAQSRQELEIAMLSVKHTLLTTPAQRLKGEDSLTKMLTWQLVLASRRTATDRENDNVLDTVLECFELLQHQVPLDSIPWMATLWQQQLDEPSSSSGDNERAVNRIALILQILTACAQSDKAKPVLLQSLPLVSLTMELQVEKDSAREEKKEEGITTVSLVESTLRFFQVLTHRQGPKEAKHAFDQTLSVILGCGRSYSSNAKFTTMICSILRNWALALGEIMAQNESVWAELKYLYNCTERLRHETTKYRPEDNLLHAQSSVLVSPDVPCHSRVNGGEPPPESTSSSHHRSALAAISGTLIVACASLDRTHPAVQCILQQDWIIREQLFCGGHTDARRRCWRTVKALLSQEENNAWGLDFLINHMPDQYTTLLLEDLQCADIATQTLACQCTEMLLPRMDPQLGPSIETSLIQIVIDQAIRDDDDNIEQYNACRKVLLATVRALTVSRRCSAWTTSSSCFGTIFFANLEAFLLSEIDYTPSHVAASQLLLILIDIPGISTQLLGNLDLFNILLSSSAGSDESRHDTVTILTRMEEKGHGLELAQDESILTQLVTVCLAAAVSEETAADFVCLGETRAAAKQLVVRLVPQL